LLFFLRFILAKFYLFLLLTYHFKNFKNPDLHLQNQVCFNYFQELYHFYRLQKQLEVILDLKLINLK